MADREFKRDPWEHRSQGMRCKTCMWFAPKQKTRVVVAKDDGMATAAQLAAGAFAGVNVSAHGSAGDLDPVYDLGRCRRRAPTMNGYPAVFVNDWCGDHKLDENKLLTL